MNTAAEAADKSLNEQARAFEGSFHLADLFAAQFEVAARSDPIGRAVIVLRWGLWSPLSFSFVSPKVASRHRLVKQKPPVLRPGAIA